MAHRVNHINKKTGVIYVYESSSYWDKAKKQARNKQVCIGKIDPLTGELIASKRLSVAPGCVDAKNITASAQIVGPTMILDVLTAQLGLAQILQSCFPETHQQIRIMAYYLLVNGGALSHCSTWCNSHAPLMASSLATQRITEVLASITYNAQQAFLKIWMQAMLEDDYLCYDITSVSSYSALNEYIKYGHNRDNEALPQLNLAVLFGQTGRLPLYFQRLPGNITDVITLHNMLKTLKALGMKKLRYVMDKGFYSKSNVDALFAAKDKFLLAVPVHNKCLQAAIDDVYESIQGPEGYRKLDDEVIYVHTRLYQWGDKKHRSYLHLYYNAHARAHAIDNFNEELLTYKQELESGQTNSKHQWAYDRFFISKTTPRRGLKVSFNETAVTQHIKRYTGFQALLSNKVKDPLQALTIYRDKDVVEKCFDDMKNQLDMKRLRMHSRKTTDGRLFVQFIALIYLSALRREMRKANLLERYTARELLQEMATLTQIQYSGKHGKILTEMTKPQRTILNSLNIQA